jgi:hypothetical protein
MRGLAGRGKAGQRKARQGSMDFRGGAWLGMVRRGMARQGEVLKVAA